MRTVYLERQTALLQAVRTMLDGLVDVKAEASGLHLVGWLPAGTNDAAISDTLLAAGIECPPLSRHAIGIRPRPGLLLGYAAFTPEALCRAVREMAAQLTRCRISPRADARNPR